MILQFFMLFLKRYSAKHSIVHDVRDNHQESYEFRYYHCYFYMFYIYIFDIYNP